MIDDDRLVRRCLDGDDAACTELVDLHTRLVGTVIWRATGDRWVVEDLTQETFLRAFRALPYFERRSKLSTWICTIANRVAIDYLRKARHDLEPVSLSSRHDLDGFRIDPASTGHADNPETAAARGEFDRVLYASLARLPDKLRLPLVYAAIDGLDYETIGAMLGVPVGTVKTHVFRARIMLRGLMEQALARPTAANEMGR